MQTMKLSAGLARTEATVSGGPVNAARADGPYGTCCGIAVIQDGIEFQHEIACRTGRKTRHPHVLPEQAALVMTSTIATSINVNPRLSPRFIIIVSNS
jgi:hypothetical protein